MFTSHAVTNTSLSSVRTFMLLLHSDTFGADQLVESNVLHETAHKVC